MLTQAILRRPNVLFASIKRADRGLLMTNLILLLWIASIPFATALLAEYIDLLNSASSR